MSIAAVYDGMSRAEAARVGGMDRQTLRDWVHRFNDEGPAGLLDRKAPGAASKLTRAQLANLTRIVEADARAAGEPRSHRRRPAPSTNGTAWSAGAASISSG